MDNLFKRTGGFAGSFATLALLCACALPSQADSVWQSQYDGLASAPTSGVSILGGRVDANSFTLSADATVRSVSFDALDCCGFQWSGAISYSLFQNNSYEPSATPFAQGSTRSYVIAGSHDFGATNLVTEYQFNLDSPLTLDAGVTYWLGISLSDPAGGDGSSWDTSSNYSIVNAGSGSGSSPYAWNLNAGQGSFALYDSTVTPTPEPDSLFLLAPCLFLAWFWFWRNRSSSRS